MKDDFYMKKLQFKFEGIFMEDEDNKPDKKYIYKSNYYEQTSNFMLD